MTVLILGLVAGALLGGRFARRIDAFRGARSGVGEATAALAKAETKFIGARSAFTRFVAVFVVGALALLYGWIRQRG